MIRKVITQNSRYKYFSITQDENKLVVRVLCPFLDRVKSTASLQDLLSTKCLRQSIVDLQETRWGVVAVGEFDKREYPQFWQAGLTITFYVTPESIARETVEFGIIENQVAITKETTQQYHKRLGHTVLCKVYCADSNQSIIDADKQLLVDTKGNLYSNIDFTDSTDCEEWDVDFGFNYKIYVPNAVTPNSSVSCPIEVTCNGMPCNGLFKAQAVTGYIACTEIDVQQGKGNLIATSLGLKQGSLKFLVGNRFYQSILAEIKISE